jgi:predicted ATP-dependent serine protease
MANKAEERRCVTGIEGLDRIIGGGSADRRDHTGGG